ncbi:hypothetical protein ACHAWO_007957 [Cyclotella atomus]|uniref:Uncharacterized protein n=1 Tax=Cyclotella atomus TaxID=382360 RepID=A0ABD3MZJ3_9STRA
MKSPTYLLLLLSLTSTAASDESINTRDVKQTLAEKFASSTPRFVSIQQIQTEKKQQEKQKSNGLAGFNSKLSLALGALDKSDESHDKKKKKNERSSGRKRTIVTVDIPIRNEKNTAAATNNGLRNKKDVNEKLSQLSESLSQALSKNSNQGGVGKSMKPKASPLPRGL